MQKNKRKIAIVSITYFWLPIEPGPSRFYYIANMLAEKGYDVEVITGSFQHFNKCQRNVEVLQNYEAPFKIKVIKMPSYKKNIDVRRLFSYGVVKNNIAKYMKKHVVEYDAVYCSVPPNNIAAAVAKICHSNGIPFIADIEDLWPEAMETMIKNFPLKRLLLSPLKIDAEKVYRVADAAIGTSDEYTARAFKNNRREILHTTVYVGCDLEVFDKGVIKHINNIEKNEDEFWGVYAGSIGHTYDIENLVQAARIVKERGYHDIKIKILGQGVLKESLERMAKDIGADNVEFLGYRSYDEMAAYLSKSDFVLNMFAKGAPQSVVNKVGDYFASGKPTINTLESEEFINLINEQDVGINVEPGNPGLLADAILEIYIDRGLCNSKGVKARVLAERKFDRKVAYLDIVQTLEKVIDSKNM